MPRELRLGRRRFLALAGAAGLAGLAHGLGGRARSVLAQRAWRVTGLAVPELSRYDDAVMAYMQQRGISAGALAVTRNGRLMLARGYAWSDNPNERVEPTSLFRIASLSKPLTAAAVMKLVEDGRLSLDARLSDLLPLQALPGATPDPRLASITVAHLLQHLGGWDRDRSFDPLFADHQIAAALNKGLPISAGDVITYMTGRPLEHTPGTTYAYGNYGYLLLGRLIEQVSALPYASYVRQAVLRPLNLWRVQLGRSSLALRHPNEVAYRSIYSASSVIDSTGAVVPAPYGGFNLENMSANGGWLASAVDLARFAASFNGGEATPILSAQSIERLFEPPPTGLNAQGWYYAKGWQVRPLAGGSRNTWHTGALAGTTTLMVRRWDDVHYTALFNQRDDANDRTSQTYYEIDDTLYTLANRTFTWPDHDLFPEYLPALDQQLFLPGVAR